MEKSIIEKEIKNHWEHIKQLFCDNYDIKNKRLVTRLERDNIPKLIINKDTR